MRRFVTAVLVAAVVLTLTGTMLAGDAPAAAPPAQQVDPLVRVLQAKGVLTAQEAQALATVPLNEQRDQLTAILLKKGVISSSDLQGASTISNERLVAAYSTSATVKPALAVETEATPAMPQAAAPPKPPPVIPAVAPIRVLPVDVPKREGLIPGFKLGPVLARPYGYVKMSLVEDSSMPLGNDFPLPGFIGDTGPNAAPEFRIKARNTRFGSAFEWLDPSKKVTITGKIELDLEGNYSATENRSISTLRTSMPSVRLAFGRIDYAASPKATIFGVFGQDWTPFGSSTLPNSLEMTGLGIGFGSLYERAQMVKGGFVYDIGGSRKSKLLLEAAMVMPSSGNQPAPWPATNNFQIPGTIPASTLAPVSTFSIIGCATAPCGYVTIPQIANQGLGVDEQLAFGERQGADSNRPEVEARVVFQFQADKAPGVAPAQLIISGVQGRRESIVLGGTIPALSSILSTGGVFPTGVTSTTYTAAFGNTATGTHGIRTSSERWGINPQFQLPTRWFTLIGSWYRGADLRWFFAGQILSFYNDTTGLSNLVTVPTIDGSGTVVLGTLSGTATVAPQRPVRTTGGFLELSLPLSRIAHANPTGRNAGWTMNLHYGRDDVFNNDLRHIATTSVRDRSDWAFVNLMYKLNSFVTLAYEQSYYRTLAFTKTGSFAGTLFRGNPARSWHDNRSEFSTIFSF